MAGAGANGTVAASAVTGGACAGTDCTLASGAGTVTFTATAADGYYFVGWSGATCAGVDSGTSRVFDRPTAPSTCVASFAKLVTISYTYSGVMLTQADGTDGAQCTSDVSGEGQCVTQPGTGTITLTASARHSR